MSQAKKLWILQNCETEGPGELGHWAQSRGLPTEIVRAWTGAGLPKLQAGDTLAVLGAPPSVHDADSLAWLRNEQRLITSAIHAGIPTLGICLGAQLIAHALGGAVARGPLPEIGWCPVTFSPAPGLLLEPSTLPLLQWHGEGFSLPPGARALAHSPAFPVQAFFWEKHVLALGPHLEATEALTHAFVKKFWAPVPPEQGRWVQSAAEILAGWLQHGAASQAAARRIFDSWLP